MEKLVANFTGKVRRERLGGREYLVAPITLIVPGVLNGSKGPGYYPLEELVASVDYWNGIPIVLNHPADQNGKTVSARNPKVLEQFGLGWVFNTMVDGKLQAEGWFDVENTKRINPSTYHAVERGEKVEVSTGLGVGYDGTAGVHNSVSYTWIARNHRPDHLAVLVNEKGACSVYDGCGVNNEAGTVEEQTEKQSIWNKLGEVLGVTQVEKIVANQPKTKPTTKVKNTQEKKMELTAEQRTALVTELVTNCACTGFKEEDREVLNELSDESLTKLKENAAKVKNVGDLEKKVKDQELVVNAATKGLKVGDTQFTLNEKGEWVTNNMKEGYEKEEEEIDPKTGKPYKKVKNQQIKLEDLPAELQEQVRYGQRVMNEHRTSLMDRLVANMEEEAKKKAIVVYNKMSIEELEVIAPPEKVENVGQGFNQSYVYVEPQHRRPNYAGQAVANSAAGAGQKTKVAPLGLPSFDFSDVNNKKQPV